MSDLVKRYEHIDELDQYFNELGKYNKLTVNEERELGRRIKNGDIYALNKLVKHNLRFVVMIAKTYRNKTNVSFSDLISEGNIGLIKAAQRYDVDKDYKFVSYAIWWIRASINECISKYKDNVEYNIEDNAFFNTKNTAVSYDDKINEDFEERLTDFQSRRAAIEDLIQCLEERERQVIMYFYGLDKYGHDMNLDEISKKMSLTKERVRQIKEVALTKMKCHAIMSSEFETYKTLV